RGQRTRPEGPFSAAHRLWAVARPAHGACWHWTDRVSAASRLLVHWQGHLPRRAQTQAVVRLYGALGCRFVSATAKRAGAADGCRRTPTKTLRLRKSEPVTVGTILCTPNAPRPVQHGLASAGLGQEQAVNREKNSTGA